MEAYMSVLFLLINQLQNINKHKTIPKFIKDIKYNHFTHVSELAIP